MKFRIDLAIRYASGELEGFSGFSDESEHDAYLKTLGLVFTRNREFIEEPVNSLTAEELHSIRLDWSRFSPVAC